MGKFRFLTAGESHGKGLSVILEGIPSNLSISEDFIEKDMSRRQKGYGSGGRMKIEKDRAEILSGVRHGKTLGSPISLWIENKDWANWTTPMSITPVDVNEDIKKQTKIVPGHADFPGTLKFNHKDVRNVLERASARETAARVAAAAVCKKFLNEIGIKIKSRAKSVGWEKSEIENIDEIDWDFVESSEVRASNANEDISFKKVIDKVKKERTTIGGIFQVIAFNVPLGLGSHTHWDNKLDGKIAQSMVSINAVKGVEIGNGFENTERWGREVQDVIEPNSSDIRNFSQISNNSGGIEGGMSNGNDIIVNVAIKPIATMTSPLPSVDIMTGEVVEAAYNRSDICQVSRACPVGEAMLALTLTESVLEKFGGDSLQEIKRNYMSYIKTFKKNMANNIFLIGFSGSGKSSVGKKLAKHLNYNFLDTDRIIEKTTSLSIDETINTKGEKEFRNIETEVLSKIDFSQNNVISTGGGLPTEKDNIRIMKNNGSIIWLKASIDSIFDRLKNSKEIRPLIGNHIEKENIESLYNSRQSVYNIADFSIDTDNKNLDEITKELISKNE